MGYIIFAVLLVFSGFGLTFSGKNAVKYLMLMCFFQNFVLLLLSRFLNATTFTLIALIKELYIIAYIFVAVYKKKRIVKDAVICCAIIALYLICLILYGRGALKGMLTSFRQLYLPFLFFAFGSVCELSREDCEEIIRFFVKCCVIAGVFGVIEMILGDHIWRTLGLANYVRAKGLSDYRIRNGLLRSFYTFDFGRGIRRMASILVDPVILGQLLGVGFILAMFVPNIFNDVKRRYLTAGFLLCCMFLTLAKGGVIIAVVSFGILMGTIVRKKIFSILLLMATIAFMIFAAFYSVDNKLSGNNHINGLISGVSTMMTHPMGTGIGSAGNMADAYGDFDNQKVSGDESYVGSLLAQLGWIGLMTNVWFWKRFFRRERNNDNVSRLLKVVNIINIALLITSFVNYTAISFTSCFIFFILAAAYNGVRRQDSICNGVIK